MPASDICFLHPFRLPSVSAHSIQILQTCLALAEAGARVCLQVKRPPGTPPRGEAAALACYGAQPHPRLHIEWLPTTHNGIAGLAARWHIRRTHRNVVFYARHLRLAVTAAHAHRGPVIVEAHNLEPDTGRAVALADGIVCITAALQARLREAFTPVAPMVVIPDGVDLSRFTPLRGDGPPRLLYTGQLMEWKGVDVFLRALAQLPGLPALIVGGQPGPDPRRDALRALATEIGVANRVVWAGHVAPHAVAALVRPGDIGVVPTRARHGEEFSASPLKLFEYMARGLPIVVADLPSLRDVVRDGENGVLFRDGDPYALADAVHRLLVDPTRRAALAAQALRDAGSYSWAARAARILAFIDVVRGTPHPNPLPARSAGRGGSGGFHSHSTTSGSPSPRIFAGRGLG